jgi:hypothetical protein
LYAAIGESGGFAAVLLPWSVGYYDEHRLAFEHAASSHICSSSSSFYSQKDIIAKAIRVDNNAMERLMNERNWLYLPCRC